MQNILKTILEDDMEKLLDVLELKPVLEKGELLCSHCKRELQKQNIFAIYPLSGDIKVACDYSSCIEKTIEQTQDQKL